MLEVSRALFFQSGLGKSYWGECVLTATHIINRIHSKVLDNKSPYEVLFKRKPCLKILKSFGCLCFASTLSVSRDKFMPRSKACIFVGYPFGQKGYKILDLQTRIITVSRDVKFVEHTFPLYHLKNHDNHESYLPKSFDDGDIQSTQTIAESTNDVHPKSPSLSQEEVLPVRRSSRNTT